MKDCCVLPDGSAFLVAEIATEQVHADPVMWNPWNKVVQDHRDGTIDHERTNQERATRGLPPWTPSATSRSTKPPGGES